MFFEKFINSKFYYVSNLILRVIWLNVIMLVTTVIGLFFFTFGPTLLAGVYTTKLIFQKYEGSVFQAFFKAFKKYYKKATLIFILYSLFIGLLGFNIYYFLIKMNDIFYWFDFFSFMISLILFIFSFSAMIHSLLIYSCYEDNKLKDYILDGYKLSFAFIVRNLLLMAFLLGLVYLSLLVPFITAIISLFLLVAAIELIVFKGYDKISAFKNLSDEKAQEFKY